MTPPQLLWLDLKGNPYNNLAHEHGVHRKPLGSGASLSVDF